MRKSGQFFQNAIFFFCSGDQNRETIGGLNAILLPVEKSKYLNEAALFQEFLLELTLLKKIRKKKKVIT